MGGVGSWTADPSVVIGVGLLSAAYAWAARRPDGPSQRQRLCFAAGVLSLLLALTGPLHDLSDYYLFTAHMGQHLVLMLVFPPLLLLSVTPSMVRPLLRPRWVMQVAREVTKPAIAFGLCNAVFAVWHLPPFYDLALRNHNVHVFEHLLFISTALLLWWPLLSPLPELPAIPHAGQLLYLFLQVLPGSLIGGLIANSSRALYPFYAAAPRITWMSAVQDQQLGAIVMWVGGGTFFLAAFTVVFFRWAAKDMAESRLHRPQP
jgi:putative membrane protein